MMQMTAPILGFFQWLASKLEEAREAEEEFLRNSSPEERIRYIDLMYGRWD